MEISPEPSWVDFTAAHEAERASRRKAHEQQSEELRQRLHDCRAAHQEAEASADEALQEERDRRTKDLQSHAFSVLVPLVAEWETSPTRAQAGKIAAAVRDLDAESKRMISEPLSEKAVSFAFAELHIQKRREVASIFAEPTLYHHHLGARVGPASHNLHASILGGADVVLIEDRLRALEAAMATAASGKSYPSSDAIERFAAISRGGTRESVEAKLAAIAARSAQGSRAR